MQIKACHWAFYMGCISHQAVGCLFLCVFLLNIACVGTSFQTPSSVLVEACLAAPPAASSLLGSETESRLYTPGFREILPIFSADLLKLRQIVGGQLNDQFQDSAEGATRGHRECL